MVKQKEPTTVAEAAPERVTVGAVVNSRELVFPFDQYGFTTILRKEGVRAVGRIKGDPAKLKVFIETLKVLGQHANTKLKDQQKVVAQQVAAAKNREAAQYVRNEQDKQREVERLQKMLDAAVAAVSLKIADPDKNADKEEE